jgi:hypothetical protein
LSERGISFVTHAVLGVGAIGGLMATIERRFITPLTSS